MLSPHGLLRFSWEGGLSFLSSTTIVCRWEACSIDSILNWAKKKILLLTSWVSYRACSPNNLSAAFLSLPLRALVDLLLQDCKRASTSLISPVQKALLTVCVRLLMPVTGGSQCRWLFPAPGGWAMVYRASLLWVGYSEVGAPPFISVKIS